MSVLGSEAPKLLLAARDKSPSPRARSPDQQRSEIQDLQREAVRLATPQDGTDAQQGHIEISSSAPTESVPPRSPLPTPQAVREVTGEAKKDKEADQAEDDAPKVMSASVLQNEYDTRAAVFEKLAADIDAQLDGSQDPDGSTADHAEIEANSELRLQLESAKSNAKSQMEARAAAESAKADAELEVRRIKRQFSTELRSSSSRVSQREQAIQKVQAQWQETAIRRRSLQLLRDAFMAWVYVNYEGHVQAAANAQAMKEAGAQIAAAEAQLEQQRTEHAQELSEIEQSVRVETAEELQKAELQSEHLRTLFVESAIRRMRSGALSRVFVAWADAAWDQEMASLESLEALAKQETEARQAAETRATEEAEAREAAEAAMTAAQAEAAEANARHQAELEAEQTAKIAADAKLAEQTEKLALEQEKARKLEQSHAAVEEQARAAVQEAAKHSGTVDAVKQLFQGAAIRRMRHGLVSRAFRAWSDATVDAVFEQQMKDLQEMADDESHARREAQDAARQAREEAEAAKAKMVVLTEAAESTVELIEEAAQAKAKVKEEAEARAAAEKAMAAAQAEAAESEARHQAVLEAELATQAKLVAQAEQLAEEQEKALELQQSQAAAEQQARTAAAQAAKHSETVDSVQGRWQEAAIRRMRHGLVSRVFRAWSDATVDAMFDLKIDDLQKLADEETQKRKAAQDAERLAREEAEAAMRKAAEQGAAVAKETRLRCVAEARLEQEAQARTRAEQELEELQLLEGADGAESLPAPPDSPGPSMPTRSMAATEPTSKPTPPLTPTGSARGHTVWNEQQQEFRLIVDREGVQLNAVGAGGRHAYMSYTQIKSWSVEDSKVTFFVRDGENATLNAQSSAEATLITEEIADTSRKSAQAVQQQQHQQQQRASGSGDGGAVAAAPATPTHSTPIRMVATPSTPASASKEGAAYFKVLQRSVVRAGVEMDSPKKSEMEVGEVIEVEETALNSKGTLRVRFSEGWTSTVSGAGVQILQRCDAEGREVGVGHGGAPPQPELE